MTRDPAYELQRSVYLALTTALGNDAPVLHDVPQDQTLPFVKIGDDIINADFDAGEFYSCVVYVHVLHTTMPLVKQMTGRVTAALALDLAVSGFMTCENHLTQVAYMAEPDGETMRATIEVMYVLQAL